MAWPGNNYNSFWESMYGPNSHHPPHGAGIDHAPPPPPPPPAGLPPFMNPDFWNRWSQGRGWEDFAGPNEGGHGGPHGPHGRHGRHAHAHAHGRRRGGGRHGRGGEDENAERGGQSGADFTDNENEAFPPEYITDDEVAAATAAEKKAGDKDGSPDTMMGDDDNNNAEDPPEELPNPDESPRQRHGGRHGRRGGRGGRGPFGREGFGPGGHHGRHGGPRGPPPPFGGFGLGGMFGGGPCRRRSRGHHGGPPPPGFEAFFGPPRGPPPHHGPGGRPHHNHHHRGPEDGAGAGAFDLRNMLGALANHPYAQQLREYLERAGGPGPHHHDSRDAGNTPDTSDDELEGSNSVTPPLDLFEQADRWVLHLAVPGAKKEDVGVHWDADRSVLSVSGVVHRPGDEAFLRGLVGAGERRVGLFSREVRLPPLTAGEGEHPAAASAAASKEEVDGDAITARMEDGVLIVTVPKVERDWTEVKRVEVE